MNISWRIIILVIACIALGVPRLAEDTRNVIPVEGDVEGTHHPSIVSIVKEGNTWYLFATVTGPSPQGQFPMRCSQDLHHWKICGFVFQQVPGWIKKESPETKELWALRAPDLSYFNGKYNLYYAFSAFGRTHLESRLPPD